MDEKKLAEKEAEWKRYASGCTFVEVPLLLSMCDTIRSQAARIAELEALPLASEVVDVTTLEEPALSPTQSAFSLQRRKGGAAM